VKTRLVDACLKLPFQGEVDRLRLKGWTPLWETFTVIHEEDDVYYYVVMERMDLDVGEKYTQDDLERDIAHDEIADGG